MSSTPVRTIAALALFALLVAGLAACSRDGARPGGAAPVQYHCPMHPSYVSDRPGQCPICKMDLVPVQPVSVGEAGRTILYYRSPMDPTIHSDVPAKDEMGMDFVPVYEDEAGASVVAGRAMVALSPERSQLLGVRSEAVVRRQLEQTIRTVGRVAIDERRLHHIHTKYEAYVEALYVNFTGQMVRRGDRLAAVYSPELVATQQEYLLAYRAQRGLAESGIPSVAQGGVDLLEAARQRLLFWDVSPEDIAALERTGKVQRTVDLHAELPGYVIQKNVVHGMRVMPADILFDIADLSAVWILADIYETDLSTVEVGTTAEVTLPYEPGRSWRGAIAFINPTVEPVTRTVKARIEVSNEDYALKPDMFADVVLRRDLGQALFVPESAVLKPGDRRLVFLDHGDGRLEPREVETGARVDGGYVVLSGLAEGDRVVTSANFLIDSESSLKAALASMGATGSAEPAAPPAAPGAGERPRERPAPAPKAAYVCPMHPQATSDRPGTCPLCGMALVRATSPGHAHP